jgi:hypothetical protein
VIEMATENRGVMVYLPSEVELRIQKYCTEYNITRKDKHGNLVTSLGSGIVAYLKSQLLSDLPRTVSDTPINGLTRTEVLDLIAESNTNNIPIVGGSGAFALAIAAFAENRSPDSLDLAVVNRLDTIEQQLSSSMGMERDDVEQLIQASEQKIMASVHSILIEMRGELAEVKTIEEQVNTRPIEISTTSQEKAIENTIESIDPDRKNSVVSARKPMSKGIKRWLEHLKDEKFRDIVQAGISEALRNQEIVIRLFNAGYGKNNNTEQYRPNLASAMKTALKASNVCFEVN